MEISYEDVDSFPHFCLCETGGQHVVFLCFNLAERGYVVYVKVKWVMDLHFFLYHICEKHSEERSHLMWAKDFHYRTQMMTVVFIEMLNPGLPSMRI